MPTAPGPTDPSPPAPARPRVRDAAGWALRLLLWTFAVLAAAAVAAPLALFGLAGGVLAAALLLLLLAATGWRRAALPLALVAGASALSAAVVAAQPTRVERSAGLLVAHPATPADVERSYHRGVGSVLVDLRDFRAPNGSETTIDAASDAGRVVVALPQRRCFRLIIEAERAPMASSSLAAWPMFLAHQAGYLRGAPDLGYVDDSGAYRLPSWNWTSPPGPLVLFGRAAPTPDGMTEAEARITAARPAPPYAPALRLRLRSAWQSYVRDYPRGVGPAFLTTDDGQLVPYEGFQQVGDAHWPAQIELPPSPGDLRAADALPSRWPRGAEGEALRRRWMRWYQRLVPAARERSRAAAGPCATPRQQAGYWSSAIVPTTENHDREAQGDPAFGVTWTFSVNADGAVRASRTADDGSTRVDRLTANPFRSGHQPAEVLR